MTRWPLLFRTAAAVVLIAVVNPAQSCSDHEDPAVGRDRLAENYPGALDILPIIASARREQLLPPANPMAALWVDRFPLRRHVHAVQQFEDTLNQAAGGAAPIAFSMVMLEPMIWTRYETANGRIKAAVHTEGAHPGDLVMVAPEDVIAAISNGRWNIREAYGAGLLGLHGKPKEIQRFLARYGLAGDNVNALQIGL